MKEKVLDDGTWWFPATLVPTAGNTQHPYFQGGCGGRLARSLRQSDGRTAILSGHDFPAALIWTNWSGTRIMSGNTEADSELSTGALMSGSPSSGTHSDKQTNRLSLVVQRLSTIRQNPFRLTSNASVFLQRNGNNYFHFIVEVLPSVMVWLDEVNALRNPHVVVPRSSFATPLLRLLGFWGAVSLVPFPSLVLARHVSVFRQLPAGYVHPDLLRTLSQRIVDAASSVSCSGSDVVLLSRGPGETRRLTNEDEVIGEIRSRFPNCDVIYPGQLGVEEQIARMRRARIVISPHGAQATNMIWARGMEHFIEIGFSTSPIQPFRALAAALGASYTLVPSSPRNAGDHYSDHTCDIGLLKSALAQL